MNERWEDIVEFKGTYMVSDLGNVINLKTGKLLSKHIVGRGYIQYPLHKNGKVKHLLAHRLVLLAFVPNPQNKPQTNHKNGIKTDNWVGNLEWATQSENMIHALNNGLNKRRISILQYSKDWVLLNEYKSLIDAKNSTGISVSAISSCINKRYKTGGGFIWVKSLNKDVFNENDYLDNKSKAVICYDKNLNIISSYRSIANASSETKISPSNISLVCNNKRKTAGGYLWKYKQHK